MSGTVEGKADRWRRAEDAALVKAARRGELAAFDELIRRYQRRATAVSYRLLNNRDDALEVTQESFLNAYEKLETLRKPARFGSWLLRIVSNRSLNKRRSRALRQAASLDAAGDDEESPGQYDPPHSREARPDLQAAAGDLAETLDREIDNLPELQRQALVLFAIEKLPQKEVAEILGCSVQAVKWHVFTARKMLKDKLGDWL